MKINTEQKIMAIDPGNFQSGFVVIVDGKISEQGTMPNTDLLVKVDQNATTKTFDVLAIEWIVGMGMAVGQEVFTTCLWAGMFAHASNTEVRMLPRSAIKLHHCGSNRANDSNVCQALRDKYGERGTKKNPGYFYGLASHAWQAFASAAFVMEGGEHDNEIRISARTKGNARRTK